MGTKARPFYRVVVARDNAGRDGAFVENLGTYNPIHKDKSLVLNNERAIHWLMNGAQPTETAARLLKRSGALEEFFTKRPAAKAGYKFLDKRTAAMSKKSVMSAPVAEPVAAPKVEAPAPEVVEAPAPEVVEAPVAEVVEAPAEAPAETPAEAPAEAIEAGPEA